MKKRKQLYIPIEDMKVSKQNMRDERKLPVVVDILPSIKKSGILSPLLVRAEKDGWRIIAGRRRWHCLKLIAKASGEKLQAPCYVLEPDDDAAAIEASIIENVGRLPPTEMQQYEAFGALESEGRKVAEIAEYFGITERVVRRVLALAGLDRAIRKLYAADDIDTATARALTLATQDQQSEWLRLWRSEDERAPLGAQCKLWVTGGETITTDHALFDLKTYDGETIEDLFGENAVFADANAFWNAQNEAVARKIKAYRDAGWRHVCLLDRGESFLSWNYVKRSKSKGGRVYIEVCYSGQVKFHEGYITEAEHQKSLRAKDSGNKEPTPQAVEMSAPLAQYVSEHRSRNVRADLTKNPALSLRLTVALMLQGSANFGMREHRVGAIKAATKASIEAGAATIAFEKERDEIAELLTSHGECFTDRHSTEKDYRLCRTFSALLKMNDAEVNRILTFAVASSLGNGDAIVEALSFVMTTDHAKYWQPDDAFYALLRDKMVINELLAEISNRRTASSMISETAKVQKEAIQNRFNGAGVNQPAHEWRPRWMSTVPTGYLKSARNPVVENWKRVAGLFTRVKSRSLSEKEQAHRKAA